MNLTTKLKWVRNLLGIDMEKGKSFAGGLVLIGLGAYLIASGDVKEGAATIAAGVAAWGIADKMDKHSAPFHKNK